MDDHFLLYPADAYPRERGLAIFTALARWLIRDPVPLGVDVRSVAAELVVPVSIARYVTVKTIAEVQPHAPLPFLYFALSAHGSDRFRRRKI